MCLLGLLQELLQIFSNVAAFMYALQQDFLNDRLQEGFLQRIRYAMKPDEAFGLIFSWDNVVVTS